jgi:hypothetical protein
VNVVNTILSLGAWKYPRNVPQKNDIISLKQSFAKKQPLALHPQLVSMTNSPMFYLRPATLSKVDGSEKPNWFQNDFEYHLRTMQI